MILWHTINTAVIDSEADSIIISTYLHDIAPSCLLALLVLVRSPSCRHPDGVVMCGHGVVVAPAVVVSSTLSRKDTCTSIAVSFGQLGTYPGIRNTDYANRSPWSRSGGTTGNLATVQAFGRYFECQ